MRTTSVFTPRLALLAAATSALCAAAAPAMASSHREAPFITTAPKVDGTDFYLFNSYEGVAANGTGGRAGYVTLIANYQPLQDAYGGPNYFKFDPNALYEIHVDNNGDAKEDLTFQFRFKNTLKNIKGVDNASSAVSIPLTAAGMVTAVNDPALNVVETYDLSVVRGDRRQGSRSTVNNTATATGAAVQGVFYKPVDYIGTKTNGTPTQYETYAQKHIGEFSVPGCASSNKAKVFVGQRQEGFAVNLGTIFDLVNAPLSVLVSARGDGTANTIADKNVSTLALEVPVECLTGTGNGVIGGWTTASLPQAPVLSASPKSGHQTTAAGGGAWVQVSRLGNPLVNEVVIGLKDKDRFNGSVPSNDGQFLNYVKKPTLPALIGAVVQDDLNTGVAGTAKAPSFDRNDLITVFLTGIPTVNQMATVTPSEMLRLQTGIKAVPYATHRSNPLGLVGGILGGGSDLAGFPNGRRPNDDVTDIALVAAMGGLCTQTVSDALQSLLNVNSAQVFGSGCVAANVPLGNAVLGITDKADQEKVLFLDRFPYLNTPSGGTK